MLLNISLWSVISFFHASRVGFGHLAFVEGLKSTVWTSCHAHTIHIYSLFLFYRQCNHKKSLIHFCDGYFFIQRLSCSEDFLVLAPCFEVLIFAMSFFVSSIYMFSPFTQQMLNVQRRRPLLSESSFETNINTREWSVDRGGNVSA